MKIFKKCKAKKVSEPTNISEFIASQLCDKNEKKEINVLYEKYHKINKINSNNLYI